MIKFPQVHIAESAVNRILNTWTEIQGLRGPVQAPMPQMQPQPPTVSPVESQMLQQQITQPAPPMAVPEGLVAPGGLLAGGL